MADVGQMLAWGDPVALSHLDRASLGVGKESVPIAGFEDDVVASQGTEVHRPFDVEGEGMLQENGEVSNEMNGIPLGPSVFGLDNGPSGR